MTGGPFCRQIDQMWKYLNTLQASFLDQQAGTTQGTVQSCIRLMHLLDRLEMESREILKTITERLRRGDVIHAAEVHLQPRNRAS
ncbi:hypothetical protein [Methanosphaerula palustris]|uniref:hypothetical protein n=1 Tax=Methanosphaerula palustris TaxID=475088 RepID=UPI00018492B8|nr:hypothetical protein [Methanosphaerula palustris]